MKKALFVSLTILLVMGLVFGYSGAAEYGGVFKQIGHRTPGKAFGYPLTIRSADHGHAQSCLEKLIKIGDAGKLEPWLATGWEFAPDWKSVTLNIRKGVKFHDGVDFNAKAVKANLDIWVKSRSPQLSTVTSVDVIDEYTVRLNLESYSSIALYDLGLHSGFMISPKAIEKGKKWAETHPVGTGPFKFKSFERDVHLKYERFDGYWQKGLPYLDGVEWDWIKDPMVSLAAFKSGQANVLLNSSGKNMYALEKEGYNVVVGPAVILGLAGDNKNPDSMFRDKRIHMAMDYAINKKKITSKLGYGYYEPLNQIAPRRSYAHVSDLKGREYNPGKAKQLLTEAGYPDGFSTTMGVLGGGSRDIWLAVQADLAEVGIKARIQWLTRPAFMAWRFKGKHPKNSLIEVVGQYTAEFLWTINNSWGLGSADIRDVARPPGWGEAIKQALVAKDFATKKARTQILTNIAHEEAFFVPITAGPRSYVMNKNIVDADIYNPDPNHWHVEKAWIKK